MGTIQDREEEGNINRRRCSGSINCGAIVLRRQVQRKFDRKAVY